MNILELDSYNLDDAVKFNDHLNPRLWDSGEHLRPEVKAQLLRIAEDFREFLGVTDLDLQDITISGSNAAYTYTPNSDIDLHLVVKMPDDEIYRELFDAKKFQYNEQHNIKIGGYDVELYVQDADAPHISQGIYSVLNNDWLQVPRRRRAEVDDTSTRNKYEKVGRQIERAVKSGNLKRISQLADKIKKMRQTGLEAHGEFGPENLAFKMLRSQGLIKQLYDARNAAKDRELSLKERRQPNSIFTYGFKHEESKEPEIVEEEPATPQLSDEEILTDFIDFCFKELKLKSMPTIKLRRDPQWSVRNKTFGRYIDDHNLLEVAWGQRHIMDVLRTVAHELTHRHQHERESVPSDAGETGSPYENEANSRAGVLMRDYARLHPEYFAVGQAEALHETEQSAQTFGVAGHKVVWEGDYFYVYKDGKLIYRSPTPRQYTKEKMLKAAELAIDHINDTSMSYYKSAPGQGADAAYKKLQQVIRHRLDKGMNVEGPTINQEVVITARDFGISVKDLLKKWAKTNPNRYMNTPELYAAYQKFNEYFQKRCGLDSAFNNMRMQGGYNAWISNQMDSYINKHGIKIKESASGYIPTKKQARDPRFSMALTQDIRPGQLGKEANKLKLKTNSQGVPQVANPNGLFEKLALELNQFKRKGTLVENEQLDEVKMSPSALQKWAQSPEAEGIQAGFEAELIFRDTDSGDDDSGDMEPDYDMDERCRSIQQVIDFFQNGEYGGMSPRQERALQEGLDEQYFEWQDEQMYASWRDERDDLIREAWLKEKPMEERIHAALVDGLELTDDQADAVMALHEKRAKKEITGQEMSEEQLEMASQYSEAAGIADDVLAEDVEQTIEKEDGFYDEVLQDFRDGFYVDDDSGFFDDVSLRWMSDVASNYDLDWPYMTGGGGNDGSRSWEEIGDSLHSAIDMPVKVSSNYHSTTRKPGMWIVEPDSSLEPDDREDFGLEIVSPPMPLEQALEKLQEVTDWANSSEGNAYTNSSTGLHMGVSVPYKGGDVDYLKLILFLGDEYVLGQFGREANTYTKSAMKSFRENIKSGRADPANAMKLMQHGLLELAQREIQKGVGQGKYTSAHIQNGYIEFRSAGGDWLAEESADPAKLTSTMLRYARAMQIAADPSADRREYAKKLYKLIAPEGDSQLALFSQFAAGELNKEQLKKRWAEKTLGNEKKINQYFKLYQNVNGTWTAVPGAEYRGMQEDEVKNRVWMKYGREALDSGEYQLVNMSDNQEWEVYDVKTGKTLEVVQAANRGAAADQVFDKYANQGIGFNVRPWVDPKTLTPRAKLAKRISEPRQKGDWDVIYKPTGRVIDNILRVDKEEAQRLLAKVAILHNFENADNLEIRPQELTKAADNTEPGDWEFYRTETGNVIDRVSNASKMQANAVRADIVRRYGHPDTSVGMRRVDQVQDIAPNVAQNFNQPQNATDRVGSWAIYDVTLGREISRMDNVAWQQASDRADELERSTGHNMSVRGLSESVDAITGRGVVVPNIMPKVNSQPKVKPTPPAIKVDVDKKKEDPLAYTYKKLVKENLVNLLIAIDQDTWLLCESDKRVELRKSRIFDQTVADKSKQLPNLPVKIQEFLAFKTANPGQPWGKDTPFISAGPLAKVPKLRHVHLTRDLSLFYSVDGRDPTVIKLYGVFDHKESGTGTPGNINRQKNLAKQLGNQFALAEGDNPADTLYFFDVGRGGRSFTNLDLKIMGLRQTKSGKWYYQPGRDSTDLLTNASIKHLEKTLNVYARPWKKPMDENFADGKGPGRPGDSQRHGIPKGATMAELEKAAKAPGRKGQLARWQLNMRRGKKK